MPSPPGTVTLLFTDLEGSSRLWEQSPEQMSVASRRHDSIVADLVEKHSGIIFKSLGDGVCAVFPEATDAVAAAQDLQLTMCREPWPTPTPLRMRIGIHTGPVERRAEDYFGHTVNLVARLVEAGHGGQTLVTQDTLRAVDGRATSLPLGRCRLRGLQQPIEVLQLETAYPQSSFPVLRGLEATPNNLPEQVNSFVGRESEVQQVLSHLEQSRLVTLCGMGGTGKSRLSLAVGAQLLATKDAVWFVELAPVSEPDLVLGAILSTLSVQGSASGLSAVIEFLKDRQAVLILDNCEQVVEAVAKLADALLKQLPGLRILASSREGLAINGELIYQVPPLPVPNSARHLTHEDLSSFGAVQLFIERAQAASSAFRAQEQDVEVLVQLCQRLDGIPLAIELAAARVRSMTAEQILARLDDRFRLLTGGSRAALPRQRTLRALVDWSYDLLDDREKDLLLRFSVFVGGSELHAAEAICASELVDELDVFDLLCALSEKSLVIQDSRNRTNPRYKLLEMVREYALDRLREKGDDELRDLRHAHADYYLALAESLAPKLVGQDAAGALDELQQEHDNLRAATSWLLAMDDGGDCGLRMVIALQRFWMTRGHLREGLDRARLALQKPSRDLPLRTRALFVAAFCAMSLGEIEEARGYFNEALVLARETNDRIQEGRALSGLAGIAGDFDIDYARSFDLNRQALQIHEEVGNVLGQAAANYNLADLTIRHDPRLENPQLAPSAMEDAERHFRDGLSLFGQLKDLKHQGICVNGMGIVAMKQKELAKAQVHFLEALQLFEQVSDRMWLGNVYKSLAWISFQQGNRERALLFAGTGIEQHEIMGFVPPVKEQEWWSEAMEMLTDGLPEALTGSLLSRGRTLTTDQAVQLANSMAEAIAAA